MSKLETRSLPGANIATQTEVHAGTQTTSSCLRSNGCVGGGGIGGSGSTSRRSRSYDERDCSRSSHHCRPRRSSSTPRRQLFDSPIMEETGSGSGASSGLRTANRPSSIGRPAVERRQLFAGSTSSVADVRKSRSHSCLRELDLDRRLPYMTPSLRSRALARRRLSTSLPPNGGRGRRTSKATLNEMLEKKSVFTIAYGDVATQKINCSADSSSNNLD